MVSPHFPGSSHTSLVTPSLLKLKTFKSCVNPVTAGVRCDSVLGPLLFIIYLLPLGHSFRKFGIHFHCYSDDSQLYILSKPVSVLPPPSLSSCLMEIKTWFSHINSLSWHKAYSGQIRLVTFIIDNSIILPSLQVKSLGVLNSILSYEEHVSYLTQTTYLHQSNINCPTAVTPLSGLPLKFLYKPQILQNSTACIITRTPSP